MTRLLVRAAVFLLAVAMPALAQRSVLVVSVADHKSGAPIESAQVWLPDLGRVGRTNWIGEAHFANVPVGSTHVVARHIGHAGSDVKVAIRGDSVGVVFMLERVNPLDTVRVTAPVVSPRLQEFAWRRAMGIGRFLGDSVLLAERSKGLPTLLVSHFAGLRVDARGIKWTVAANCALKIYFDGFPFPPSLDDLDPGDLAGVEYYSTGSAPAQYRTPGTECVLLLWSRF